jgi:hypothetical protein
MPALVHAIMWCAVLTAPRARDLLLDASKYHHKMNIHLAVVRVFPPMRHIPGYITMGHYERLPHICGTLYTQAFDID